MKPFTLILPWLTLAGGAALAGSDSSFSLSASAEDFGNYFPSYLANGYFSTMTAPRGTEGNLAYMVAFMDYGADDIARPAAIPGWSEIDYSTGDSAAGHFWMTQVPLSAAQFEDYSQVLNMRDATLTTRYRYVDHGRSTQIKVTTFVSQASTHLAATQISLTPDFDGTVQLSFALNLWAPYQPRLPLAKLTGEEMQEAVAAHNMKLEAIPPATPDRAAVWYHGDTHVLAADGDTRELTLWLDGRAEQGLRMAEAAALRLSDGIQATDIALYKSQYRLALNLNVKVQKNRTYTFTKFVAASREDWGGDAKSDLELATQARGAGFDSLLEGHRTAWRDLWRSDIAIEGDARAQTAVHSDLYYLLATSTADTHWPMGACGLTPGYTGHAFWDSDSWIFPALLLLHPERAKSLVMFRDRTLGAAQLRAHERQYSGAMFPWESDPENGSEQTPHSAYVLGEREIHVNGDIAIAQWQYYLATQDLEWLKTSGWPVIREVARFWASRAIYVPPRHRYEIQHVASVHESYSDIPNDSFTNASASTALAVATRAAKLVGERPDPLWADIARRLYIPTGGTVEHHLTFDPTVQVDPDARSGSSLLLSFPSLDLPMSMAMRRGDYANAVSPESRIQGVSDSMGLAPRSIAAAINGDTSAAADWFADNFTNGTLKPPFNVRTETAGNNTGYFITGSGGYIQNLVYGFTGLRIREQGLVEAYAPMLPEGWKSLTLQNISIRGQHFDIVVARDAGGHATLVRRRR